MRADATIIPCVSGPLDDDTLMPAALALREGGLVVFPTETVYGLGANALDPHAVRRIFTAKGRPAGNPLIVHVPNAEGARALAGHWPETAAALAEQMWPGPVTIVVQRGPSVPDIVTGGGPTVALRCPDHPIARRLIELAGVPVAAPSANVSGSVSPTRVEHLCPRIRAASEYIIDAGPCEYGLESTVIDLTVTPPTLLRPGAMSRASIAAVVGPLSDDRSPSGGSPARSPGTQGKHYAPRAEVILVEIPASGEAHCRRGINDHLLRDRDQRGKIAWVTHDPECEEVLSAAASVIVMPSSPCAYGRRLYAVLQELDAAGMETIAVHLPPDTPEWEAVRDRLRRAALR